jgi:hypothetical protein
METIMETIMETAKGNPGSVGQEAGGIHLPSLIKNTNSFILFYPSADNRKLK